MSYLDDVIDIICEVLYDEIDALLMRGEFDHVDTLLRTFVLPGQSATVMLALISITSPARNVLKEWEHYVERVRKHLAATQPDRVDELMREWGSWVSVRKDKV